MEQAVGDQRAPKSLVSGAQWREHAVISHAVAHVPPLGQKVVETVSRTQHGLEELSADRLTTTTQRGQSPGPANASLYDSAGKINFKAGC